MESIQDNFFDVWRIGLQSRVIHPPKQKHVSMVIEGYPVEKLVKLHVNNVSDAVLGTNYYPRRKKGFCA